MDDEGVPDADKFEIPTIPFASVPLYVPPCIVPETVKLDKVPTLVIFGCAAVVITPLKNGAEIVP